MKSRFIRILQANMQQVPEETRNALMPFCITIKMSTVPVNGGIQRSTILDLDE